MIFRSLSVAILMCSAITCYTQNLEEKQSALKDLIERTADFLPLDVPMGKLYTVNFSEPLTLNYEIHIVRKIEGSDSLFLLNARGHKLEEIETESAMRQLKKMGVTFDYLIIHHKNYSWKTKPDTIGGFQITPADYGYVDPSSKKGFSLKKSWYSYIDTIIVGAFSFLLFGVAALILKLINRRKRKS